MKLIVNPHKIEIEKTPVNEKEINVTTIEFEFADEITNDFVKEAYFTINGDSYKQIIVNNQCNIPGEVLQEKGQVEIGVVAYLVESETEIKRYNPSPVFISTLSGSLKDAENTEPITPSEMEQFEQALQVGLNAIGEAIEDASTLDIDATKTGDVATITITKQDGTTKEVEINDGVPGTPGRDGRDGTDGNPGPANTLSIGTVESGENASATITGTSPNQTLNLVLPKGDKGDTGNTGSTGPAGRDGVDGSDGVSPIISTSKSGKTTTLTIVDAEGTKTSTILDGNDGSNGTDGSDGYSPSASVSKVNGIATITITDKSGTTTADVSDGSDGADGQNGVDGFSPTASVSKSGSTATISITDKNGTTTTTISDGVNGTNGTNGSDGVGLQFNWSGTYLGVKREDDDDYTYQNLQGATGQTGANGQDGQDGQDGFSPIANVTQSGNATTITIRDKIGTTSATIYNDNTYSTTKTPIGVWIDGKTLYRKVIDNISITTSTFYVDTNENKIDKIINFYAIEYNSAGTEAFKTGHPTFSTQASSNYGRQMVFEQSNNRFKLQQGGAVTYPSSAVIIFEFTERTI